MAKIFISYVRDDSAELVEKLAARIKFEGHEPIVDVLTLNPGEPWEAALKKSIALSDVLLLIITPAVKDSINVYKEFQEAVHQNKKIIPVRILDSELPVWLQELHAYGSDGKNLDGIILALERYLRTLSTPPIPVQKQPNRKKLLWLLGGVVLLAALIIGLLLTSGSKDKKAPSEPLTATTVVVATLAPTPTPTLSARFDLLDLTVWSTDIGVSDALRALFTEWSEKYAPGSSIWIQEVDADTLDTLLASTPASDLPDLFIIDAVNFPKLVDQNYIQSIVDLIAPADTVFPRFEAPINEFLVPLSAKSHIMLMYNKQLVPAPPETFNQLVSIAQTLDSPQVRGFSYNLAEPYWFIGFAGGFGGSPFDDSGNPTLNTQPWIDAYQLVQNLIFVDKVLPYSCDYECLDIGFREGRTAMVLQGDWAIRYYLDSEASPALGPDNLGVAPWPVLPNGQQARPFRNFLYVTLSAQLEDTRRDAAAAFVNWLTTDEEAVTSYVHITQYLPALTSIYDSPVIQDDPRLSASARAFESSINFPQQPMKCVWLALYDVLPRVISKELPPEEAAQTAQQSAEQCLAE